jgi:divalent metal cation (Fe/Co/Zn/Cd) transporter
MTANGLRLAPSCFRSSALLRKIDIAEKIGSRASRADAMEAVTCGWLSFVAVTSLAVQWLVGAWWIDSIGSLAIVWFLVKEGREAWSGEDCCSD